MSKTWLRYIKTAAIHLGFWVLVWFLFYYFFNYNSSDGEYVVWFSSLLLPLTIAITYFAVYFLIPKYLLTKDYKRFFLFSFYTLVASSYFIVLIIYGCLFILKKMDATNIPPMMKNFFFILILVYLVVGAVSLITILNASFTAQKKYKELQNKILSAELEMKKQEIQYLKMQIHPHFLFNTLNTIYGFSLKKSDRTPELILKLSDLLDYILYDVGKPKVRLKDEVEHIKAYIELEKIRFADTLKVEFISEEISEEIMISPMLLIPFVENAFKHGGQVNGFLEVRAEIKVDMEALLFTIRNTVKMAKPEMKGGIGLQNIRKRLSLHYEDRFSLSTGMENGYFVVHLKILDLKNVESL